MIAHIPHSSTAKNSDPILCCYVNASSQLQIVRINNISNGYLERTVFPGQRLLFEALPEAKLEIYTSEMASAVLADTILCTHLRVEEKAP